MVEIQSDILQIQNWFDAVYFDLDCFAVCSKRGITVRLVSGGI